MFVITPPRGLKLLAVCNMSCNTLWVLLAHDSKEQLVGRDINQACVHIKYLTSGTALLHAPSLGAQCSRADIPQTGLCSTGWGCVISHRHHRGERQKEGLGCGEHRDSSRHGRAHLCSLTHKINALKIRKWTRSPG